MKRLTNARNRCVFCKAADEECAFAAGEFSAPCPDYKTYQRLSAIEDILGDDYDLERLKELVQADREGKCVVLPCKIGSKLYRTSMRKMQVYEVSVSREYFHDSKNKTTLFAIQIFENGKKSTSYECFEEKDIGKTVFLTREEAEAALEKMKEGDK